MNMRRSARLSARRSSVGGSESDFNFTESEDEVQKQIVAGTPIARRKTRPSLGASTAKKRGRRTTLVSTILEVEDGENAEEVESASHSEKKEDSGLTELDADESTVLPRSETVIASYRDSIEEIVPFVVLSRDECIVVPEAKQTQVIKSPTSKAKDDTSDVQPTLLSKSPKTEALVAEKEPRRRFNFSSSSSFQGERNLLKLTTDVFKNLPFKLTKDDVVGKNAKSAAKNVHKLDVISLNFEDKPGKSDPGELASQLDPRMDSNDLYFEISETCGPVVSKVDKNAKKKDPIMKKSVLKSDLEKQDSAPIVHESMTQIMKKRRKEKAETAGPGWFHLPKTEVTEELKKDFQLMKMRNILDPKRYYKKSSKKPPVYFQVGTVVEGAKDFYSSRIPKKDRKRTMVDQLLDDADFRRKNKKKYLEIQKKKESGGKKYFKKMKNKSKPTWAKK